MRSNILKALGVLGAGLACAVAGYQFAAALYGQDIAELREDYATRARELEEQYREKESLANAKVRAAWEERDIALARANDLSDDVPGCASRPTPPAVDCPQSPQVPATLKESSLPDAQAYSKEARSWFEEVSNYLSALR